MTDMTAAIRRAETDWADGRNWIATVGGEPVCGRDGKPIRHRTPEAAQETADLQAFVRSDA